MAKYVSKDYAQEFTNQVISILESGEVAPWQKPWNSKDGLCNAFTKRPYSGINVFILMLAAAQNNFQSSYWATFKQITAAGGKVKKGSKGTAIAFFKGMKIEDKDTGEDKEIFVRKFFTVFNLDQVEGVEIEETAPVFAESSEDERKEALLTHLMAFTEQEGIIYKVGGNRAYYSPVTDLVQMPENFNSLGGYCGTLAHEFIHSTGHKKRLDRFSDTAVNTREYREEYAREELVAELGAGLLCGMFGITCELENHVSYLASWLKHLKNDKEFIFKAASAAQKAINYIADAVEQKEVKTA